LSNDIPQELINFEVPDYEFDGSEVLEMIKEMPEKPIFLKNRESSARDISYEKFRKKRYPDRKVPPLDEEVIKILFYAVQEMNKSFQTMKGSYSITNYKLWIEIHQDYDIILVAFIPNMIPSFEGAYFEIPSQGKWQNGPGVNLYYSISKYELLKKSYMR
jgi:hypothetical protein